MHKTRLAQDLIGSDEAARICGVDRATFNRWSSAGKITPVLTRPGRTGLKLYQRRDVELLALTGPADGRRKANRKPVRP